MIKFTFFLDVVDVVCQLGDLTCAVCLSMLSSQRQLFSRYNQRSFLYSFLVDLEFFQGLHLVGIQKRTRIISASKDLLYSF